MVAAIFAIIALPDLSRGSAVWCGVAMSGAVLLACLTRCLLGQRTTRHSVLYGPDSAAWRTEFILSVERLLRVAMCAVCMPRYCLEPHPGDNVALLVSSAAEVYGELRATGATRGDIMNGIALLAEEPRKPRPAREALSQEDWDEMPTVARMARLSIACYTGMMMDLGRNP